MDTTQISQKNEYLPQWRPVLELLIVLVTIIGCTIPLNIHFDNRAMAQIDAMDKRSGEQINSMNITLKAIQDEMRDFHGRLCAIEERNKGK